MSKKVAKLSLASKLAKKERILKSASVIVKPEIKDIEDLGATGTPLFFSPVQTRNQRRENILRKDTKKSEPLPVQLKKPRQLQAPIKSEIKVDSVDEAAIEDSKEAIATAKVKASIGYNADPYNLEWAPQSWWLQLNNIRLMRSVGKAPVDTMGCHECADGSADEKTQRFHKLVALMLSSQTKDETTYAAMNRLKERTLTPHSILGMSATDLEQLLNPVSFYRNKAKYLKQTSQILIDKYQADIPENVKELMALPGVGPKMAHICMATAWNQVTGIGVDVHVHRVSNRLAWLKKPTKEPEQTRVALENWLPRELWPEINHLLVGFGQTICTPVKPKCFGCLNIENCPSANKSPSPTKKSRK